MNQLELRLRVQNILTQNINSLINQGVSFTMLEDALYKILIEVKDGAQREFLASVTAPAEQEGEVKEEEE